MSHVDHLGPVVVTVSVTWIVLRSRGYLWKRFFSLNEKNTSTRLNHFYLHNDYSGDSSCHLYKHIFSTSSGTRKVLPSHKVHRAALISISLAFRQTPVYTVRLRPSALHQVPVYALAFTGTYFTYLALRDSQDVQESSTYSSWYIFQRRRRVILGGWFIPSFVPMQDRTASVAPYRFRP